MTDPPPPAPVLSPPGPAFPTEPPFGPTVPPFAPVFGPPTPPTPPAPSGPVLGPPTPPRPALDLRGGAGGTRARLEALVAAAARVGRAADGMEEAARRTQVALLRVEQTAAVSPSTATSARIAAAPLLAADRGLRARAADARRAADGLRTAAAVYEGADRDAAAALRSAGIVVGHHLGEAGPFAVLLASGLAGVGLLLSGGALLQARLLRGTPTVPGLVLRQLGSPRLREWSGPLGWFARAVGGPGLLPTDLGVPHASAVESIVPGLAAMLRALQPGRQTITGDPVPEVARDLRGLAALATLLVGTPLPGLVVAPLAQSPDAPSNQPPRVPTGTADLVDEINRAGSTGTPGTFSVTELGYDDDTRTFVVAIPGMESMTLLDAPGPRDNAGNLELMAGLHNDQVEAVLDVLTRSGLGSGDQVVIAGYSQGGLAAMTIANRIDTVCPSVVVTAGSPVAHMPTPQGATVAHLEHPLDMVPALDGAPNPDEPGRLTVTREVSTTPGPPSSLLHRVGADLSDAHGLAAYGEIARQLDASPHRSAAAVHRAIADAVGTPVTVNRTDYVATRVPASG